MTQPVPAPRARAPPELETDGATACTGGMANANTGVPSMPMLLMPPLDRPRSSAANDAATISKGDP